MTNKETQTGLNKVVEDINTILAGKQSETTKQHEFDPLLIGFKLCLSQMTVFESGVTIKSNVCIDKDEPHSETLIVERTISACDYMIDVLKIHVDKLEGMLTPTPR